MKNKKISRDDDLDIKTHTRVAKLQSLVKKIKENGVRLLDSIARHLPDKDHENGNTDNRS